MVFLLSTRVRKSMMRKTVDYHSSFLNMVEARVWQRRDRRDRPAIQPDTMYGPEIGKEIVYSGARLISRAHRMSINGLSLLYLLICIIE